MMNSLDCFDKQENDLIDYLIAYPDYGIMLLNDLKNRKLIEREEN